MAARADGFALVGCELGAGVVDLRCILDLLQSDSPQTSLNIGVSAQKHVCAALDEAYLRRVPEASAYDLGRTLRLVRDQGLLREPELPIERGVSEQELLAAEDDLVVRSVEWANEALGRPDSELADSGG
jgi:hypothetical protein